MKKAQILLMLSVWILLAGCSSKTSIQSEETGALQTGATQTTEQTWTNSSTSVESSWTQQDINSWTEIKNNVESNTTLTWWESKNSDTATQDNALKDKIKAMIDKRKANLSWTTGLTEEDIQLMEDILKEIVDSSGQK